jgi:hypothetical protein
MGGIKMKNVRFETVEQFLARGGVIVRVKTSQILRVSFTRKTKPAPVRTTRAAA